MQANSNQKIYKFEVTHKVVFFFGFYFISIYRLCLLKKKIELIIFRLVFKLSRDLVVGKHAQCADMKVTKPESYMMEQSITNFKQPPGRSIAVLFLCFFYNLKKLELQNVENEGSIAYRLDGFPISFYYFSNVNFIQFSKLFNHTFFIFFFSLEFKLYGEVMWFENGIKNYEKPCHQKTKN